MANPFVKKQSGNPFVKKGENPFKKEEATWGETIEAIPGQFKAGMKQAAGGMMRALGENQRERPAEMPVHPVTGAPMPGGQWTGEREQESMEALSDKGAETFAKGSEEMREATPEDQTFWQEAVSTAAQSFGQSAPLALGAAITRQPGLVAGGFGAQEFGRAYGEARAEGLDPADATRHATLSGAIEAGTEYLPGKALFKKGSGPAKRLTNFLAREIPGENVAEIGQMVNDYASGLRDDITGEDVIDTMKMTSAATLIGGSVQSGSAHAFVKATEKIADRKQEPVKDVIADKKAENDKLTPEQRDELATKKADKKVGDLPKEQAEEAVKRIRAERQTEKPLDEVVPEKNVKDMTVEELQTALLTNDLTGLPNRRAFIEAPKKPGRVSADVDSLKYFNDTFGHDAGNSLLKAVAAQMKEEGLEAYHISGDEFLVQADSPNAAKEAMQRLEERLKSATMTVETPDGRVFEYEPGLSYGTAKQLSKAEQRLKRHKKARERAGERSDRGDRPPSLREITEPDRGGRVRSEGREGPVQTPAEPSALEQGLAQQAETRQDLPADLPPAARSLLAELGDDSLRSELEDRLASGEITPEQLTTAQAAREIVSDRETGKFAGNINLSRIQSTQELDGLFTAMAEQYGDQKEIVPHEQTIEEAKEMGLAEEDVRRWDRKEGITREKMLAARQVLVESGNDLVDKAKQARGGDAQSLLRFKGALERHNALMAKVSGMTAEAGRILNQFNITAKSAQGSLKDIENIMSSSGDKLQEAAKYMSELDDPRARNKFARDAYRARASDVLLEAWINALLSGPATHMVNVSSNTLVSWVTSAEHFVAAGLSKATGGQITFKEARANAAGWMMGAQDGLRLATKAFVTEEPTDQSTKLEQRRYKAISSEALGASGATGRAVDVAGQAVRIPGRFLMAEDEFFKSIGYRQGLNALAVRRGINEGLRNEELNQRVQELLRDPPEEMRNRAWQQAEYQTFTNPLGSMGRSFMRFANSHPSLKLIVPFIRTPTNIVKFAGERSPVAPLFEGYRDQLRGKGDIPAELAWARMMAGSAIWATAGYFASLGLITGGGPDEPEKKAALYRKGWQPFSVKFGDTYYSYGRLEPLGMLLGTAADAVNIWDRATQAERDEMASLLVVSAVGSLGNNLLSKTWLEGVSNLFQAINDPERYGARWWQRFVGTVVPTATAQAARTKDPHLRRVESMTDAIRSRIPGEREKLLPRLNLWGEPIKLEGGLGPDVVSPIYTSTDKKDPVEEEMERLEIFPRMPPEKINKVELTDEQHNEFIELAGRPAKRMLNEIINEPDYHRLPVYAKQEAIERTIDKARDEARKRMMLRYPDLLRKQAQQRVEEITQ